MDQGPHGVFRIRAAVPDDAETVAAVHVAAWQEAYRGLLADGYLASLSVDGRARHWDGVIAGLSRDFLLVAEVGPTVVGYSHVGPNRDIDAAPHTGELYSLYLHPDWWGAGFGRAVHDAALVRLAENGYGLATLWMLRTNQRARRFYERQGWSQVAGVRTQEFDGQVVTDDRFNRPLSLPAT
jgi:ribosomal protein S18 acetylase RimI-like enzyme